MTLVGIMSLWLFKQQMPIEISTVERCLEMKTKTAQNVGFTQYIVMNKLAEYSSKGYVDNSFENPRRHTQF